MDGSQKHFDKPKKQGTKIISYLYIDRQHSRTSAQNLSVETCWWEGGRGERFNPSFFLFQTLESAHLPLSLCELHLPGRLSASPKYAPIPPVVSFSFELRGVIGLNLPVSGIFQLSFPFLFLSSFWTESVFSVLQNLLIYGGVFYSPNTVYLTNCVMCGHDRDHWVHSC